MEYILQLCHDDVILIVPVGNTLVTVGYGVIVFVVLKVPVVVVPQPARVPIDTPDSVD